MNFHFNKNIKVFPNAIDILENKIIREKILNSPLYWKGRDLPNTAVNALWNEFKTDDPIHIKLQNLIFEKEPKIEKLQFQKSGINVCMPQVNPPYFHLDGNQTITCLYYINESEELNELGETQFDFTDYIFGIKSEPGKLIIFDGSIPHRTTYFRSKIRITLHFKYLNPTHIKIFNDP